MDSNNATLPPIADERPFQFRLMHLLVAVAIVAAVLAVMVPLIRSSLRQGDEASCGNNLRQIALALQNYHDTYKRFPPAYLVDTTGKPVHSWRVLIWPYVMNDHRHHLYDFTEPWNGPSNSKLVTQMASGYDCPADPTSPPGMTNYVAIVGKGTMWPGAKSADFVDIKDGPSNTIMIVEISHSDIHWMEPRDLPVEELAEWLDPAHKPRLFGNHIEGGFVAYADGHVEMLPRDVTIQRLKALVSPAGKD